MSCDHVLFTVSGSSAEFDALQDWALKNAVKAAVAHCDAERTIRAACSLRTPQRPTRIKGQIAAIIAGKGHVVVEAVGNQELLLNEIAGIVDADGGVEWISGRHADEVLLKRGRHVEASAPHTLLVHNVTLDELLHARGRLAFGQRAAGLLRPLPRWVSAAVIASRLAVECPIQHACPSPEMLRLWATENQQRLLYIRAKERDDADLDCPICWQNRQTTVAPGKVSALLPTLGAAGWDAGHLHLAHAEHGIAAMLTDAKRVTLSRGREPVRSKPKRKRMKQMPIG